MVNERIFDRHPGLSSREGERIFLNQAQESLFGTGIKLSADQLTPVSSQEYSPYDFIQNAEEFRLAVLWILGHKEINLSQLRINKNKKGEVQVLIPKKVKVNPRHLRQERGTMLSNALAFAIHAEEKPSNFQD